MVLSVRGISTLSGGAVATIIYNQRALAHSDEFQYVSTHIDELSVCLLTLMSFSVRLLTVMSFSKCLLTLMSSACVCSH